MSIVETQAIGQTVMLLLVAGKRIGDAANKPPMTTMGEDKAGRPVPIRTAEAAVQLRTAEFLRDCARHVGGLLPQEVA